MATPRRVAGGEDHEVGPHGNLRKSEEAEEIFRFIAFWKKAHGKNPHHLVFDSQLTTYVNYAPPARPRITDMVYLPASDPWKGSG